MRKRYFALAMAIFIVGLSSIAMSEEATPPQEDRYAPSRLGMPDAISGYSVLAVLTEDNFMCMQPGEKRLVLQAPQPTIEDALRDFPKERSGEGAQSLNLTEDGKWRWSIVGPGVTREQIVSQLDKSYRSFKAHGCTALQLPDGGVCSNTGECKYTTPFAGFAIIQNTSINNSDKVVGQSVVLVAPVVGNHQDGIWSDNLEEVKNHWPVKECFPHIEHYCNHHYGYISFVNNGMTNGGSFLQVGLYFTNKATIAADGSVSPGDQACQAPAGCFGEGLVVWAGDQSHLGARALFKADPNAQPAFVPYIPGHEYYTTITYTSNVWWTCAADLANTSTYQCQIHPDAKGDHLIEHRAGTNVFVETWNQNRNWAGGFTIQWAAHDARIYVNGLPPQPWSSQKVWTIDSCPDAWPATNAVVNSLIPDGRQFNDGWAFFNADGFIPPFCF